jgi:hypothetical protein
MARRHSWFAQKLCARGIVHTSHTVTARFLPSTQIANTPHSACCPTCEHHFQITAHPPWARPTLLSRHNAEGSVAPSCQRFLFLTKILPQETHLNDRCIPNLRRSIGEARGGYVDNHFSIFSGLSLQFDAWRGWTVSSNGLKKSSKWPLSDKSNGRTCKTSLTLFVSYQQDGALTRSEGGRVSNLGFLARCNRICHVRVMISVRQGLR